MTRLGAYTLAACCSGLLCGLGPPDPGITVTAAGGLGEQSLIRSGGCAGARFAWPVKSGVGYGRVVQRRDGGLSLSVEGVVAPGTVGTPHLLFLGEQRVPYELFEYGDSYDFASANARVGQHLRYWGIEAGPVVAYREDVGGPFLGGALQAWGGRPDVAFGWVELGSEVRTDPYAFAIQTGIGTIRPHGRLFAGVGFGSLRLQGDLNLDPTWSVGADLGATAPIYLNVSPNWYGVARLSHRGPLLRPAR